MESGALSRLISKNMIRHFISRNFKNGFSGYALTTHLKRTSLSFTFENLSFTLGSRKHTEDFILETVLISDPDCEKQTDNRSNLFCRFQYNIRMLAQKCKLTELFG